MLALLRATGFPLGRGSGPIVISVFILVVLTAVSGVPLGQGRSQWAMTLAVGTALTFLSAVVLQSLDFEESR
jgi:hypothetical protein